MSVKDIGSLLMTMFGCSFSNCLIAASAQFANVTTVLPLLVVPPDPPDPPEVQALAARATIAATRPRAGHDCQKALRARDPCARRDTRPGCRGTSARCVAGWLDFSMDMPSPSAQWSDL